MMKQLLLLICAILCFSCRTSSGSFEEKRDIHNARTLEEYSREVLTQSIMDSIIKRFTFTLDANITTFAPRDSTGIQDVLSITNLHLTGEKFSEQNTTADTNIMKESTAVINETQEDKTEITVTKETDNRIFRPPDWIWVIVSLFIIVFIIVLRSRLRR